MRRILMILTTAAGMTLFGCGVAAAGTVTTDFEAFTLGTVNGQVGWKSAPPGAIPACNPTPTGGAYDQAVVLNPLVNGPAAAFGKRSLRMSNACTSGEFFYQTYSTPVVPAAGEDRATSEYIAQFSFISKTPGAQQPGLFLSVSPDSYEGSRMSWVGLEDTPTGIHVTVSDTPEVNGEFVDYDAGTLDRQVPHTIRFWIKLIPGEDNDVVRIDIDGHVVSHDGGECFTTWENYYRTSPEQAPPPNVNTPAEIRSLQFRSGGTAAPELLGGGYLYDNVTVTTADGPGPAGCGEEEDVVIDKTTQTRSARPGGLITYRITVRNRGDAPVRSTRACDRRPRALRFVRATRRLQRAAGRRLCLMVRRLAPGERRTFRATFRLRANVTADTVTNGGSADVPTGSVPSPSPPQGPGSRPRRRRVARDSATIGVRRAQARGCPAAVHPRARAAC
jgi:uncharacterized repeat protein (TIGR01451 family)